MRTVALLVIAIPEGLPLAVSLALAWAAHKMLVKDAGVPGGSLLVRHLSACETMSAVTAICTDKTGTLTVNRMTVTTSKILGDNDDEKLLKECIVLNSTAYWDEEAGDFVGNATEVALLKWAFRNFSAKTGNVWESIKNEAKVIEIDPFSSTRKSMTTKVEKRDGVFVFTKGAPDVVLKQTLTKDAETDDFKSFMEEAAKKCLRTIALAYKREKDAEFTSLGFLGLEDPLRDNVGEAVKACHDAGITVRMVTGDALEIAKAIGRQSGILKPGGLAMEGPAFRKLFPKNKDNLIDEEDLCRKAVAKAKLGRLQVLARATPEDKLILVKVLQEYFGDVVAVTGDGANDGPALTAANVGLAMTGAELESFRFTPLSNDANNRVITAKRPNNTAVAQAAADVLLLQDDFGGVVRGVAWGRCVVKSVRSFLQFQLTINAVAVTLVTLSAIIDGDAEPLLWPIQLLWINVLMDSIAALALASQQPNQQELMTKPPDQSPIISMGMWWFVGWHVTFQIIILSSLAWLVPLRDKSSFVFNCFVWMQLGNLWNARHVLDSQKRHLTLNFISSGRLFVILWFSCCAGQVLVMTVGSTIMHVNPMNSIEWLASCSVGLLGSLLWGLLVRCFIPMPNAFITKPVSSRPQVAHLAWRQAIEKVDKGLWVYRALKGRLLISTPPMN